MEMAWKQSIVVSQFGWVSTIALSRVRSLTGMVTVHSRNLGTQLKHALKMNRHISVLGLKTD